MPLDGAVQRAQRLAVLYCADIHKQTVPQLLTLQTELRALYAALAELGWPRLEGARLGWAQRCPLFAVRMREPRHCCNLVRLCPFCFARRVVAETYYRLEFACYKTFSHLQPQDSAPLVVALPLACQLVGIRQHHYLSSKLDAQQEVVRSREYMEDRRNFLGATRLATMEPHRDGWLVVTRYLLLVAVGFKLPASGPTRFSLPDDKHDVGPKHRVTIQVRHEERISQRALVRLVGWTFSYPAGLLRQEPLQLLEMISVLVEKRCLQHFGVLRNGVARDLAAQRGLLV